MILDVLENRERYAATNTPIGRALYYLSNTAFSTLEDGKQPIDGEETYALILSYRTEPESQRRFEAHRRYIDVQCILSGREMILWSPTEELSQRGEYSREKDIVFLSGDARARLHLTPGSFALFYPEDAHKPNCAWDRLQQVRKVVVKVRIG